MARRRSRRSSRSGLGGAAVGGIALMILAALSLAALGAFYYFAPRNPPLDPDTLCPVAGPYGITVVLVDATDDLPPPAQREAAKIIDDLITGLPAYFKLDIRVLDIETMRSRSLFAKCNPGDGTGLSEWTGNPRRARLRWIENFRTPAAEAMKNSLASAKAKSSPIMAALQDIAIGEFTGAAAEKAEKKLVVISDMLEFVPREYSQYPAAGDLSYARFKRSPSYQKRWTNLHGAEMSIWYVTRLEPKIDSGKHIEFWGEWIKDSRGKVGKLRRLQGAN